MPDVIAKIVGSDEQYIDTVHFRNCIDLVRAQILANEHK